MKLNMGCGFVKKEGFCNIDNNPQVNPDMLIDARKPLPFEDSSVEYINANQFWEHFGDELFPMVQDWHRVCKNGGIIHVEVPNAKDHPEYAMRDPSHKRLFVPDTFRYFNCEDELWQTFGKHYGIPPLRIKSLALANDKHDIIVEFQVVK